MKVGDKFYAAVKIGDAFYTPRFCTVKIEAVFESERDAREAGYTEPTYYECDGFVILGKSLDLYHMVFCAAKQDTRR